MQPKAKSENLLETSAIAEKSGYSNKPQGLPEQFWDEQTGEVRLEELIAAYNDLARRDDNLIETNLRNMP